MANCHRCGRGTSGDEAFCGACKQIRDAEQNWPWYAAVIPSVGDVLMQIEAESLDALMDPAARVRFRSFFIVMYGKDPETGKPQARLRPWPPNLFGIVDKEGVGVILAGQLLMIAGATKEAIEEAQRVNKGESEVEMPVPATQADVADAAAQARMRSAMASAFKKLPPPKK